MPTTRPGFIWSGTEWVAIGQEAVVNPFYYQATAPVGAATGAIWIESDVDVPSIDSSQFLRWRKTMSGGETTLSGNDDSSLPLQYTPGYEQLYINGVLQVRGGDYTATTGTTVTGLTALVANDVVEIFSAVARTVADVYTQTQSDSRFVNRNSGGLNLVVPTGAINGTVSANGAVTIGSAVNSVTVNGAFSSTYENYKIVVTGGVNTSGATFIGLALGSTFTGYYNSRLGLSWTNTTPATQVLTNHSSFIFAGAGSANNFNMNVDVLQPFENKQTVMTSVAVQAATNGQFYNSACYLDNTTSYTQFNIFPNGGTLTGGTIYVYGYNKGA